MIIIINFLYIGLIYRGVQNSCTRKIAKQFLGPMSPWLIRAPKSIKWKIDTTHIAPPQGIIRLIINKFIVPRSTDNGLSRHLRKHPRIAKGLGFKIIPHRTTIGK